MCPQASDGQCVLAPLVAVSWSDVRLTSSDSLHRLFHADEDILNQHWCGQRFSLKNLRPPKVFIFKTTHVNLDKATLYLQHTQ